MLDSGPHDVANDLSYPFPILFLLLHLRRAAVHLLLDEASSFDVRAPPYSSYSLRPPELMEPSSLGGHQARSVGSLPGQSPAKLSPWQIGGYSFFFSPRSRPPLEAHGRHSGRARQAPSLQPPRVGPPVVDSEGSYPAGGRNGRRRTVDLVKMCP
jgi:hypothetical protein